MGFLGAHVGVPDRYDRLRVGRLARERVGLVVRQRYLHCLRASSEHHRADADQRLQHGRSGFLCVFHAAFIAQMLTNGAITS